MEKRTNRPARLVEHLEEDFGGDVLGGIMANHELMLSRTPIIEQPSEAIRPDNSIEFPISEVVFDASAPEADKS